MDRILETISQQIDQGIYPGASLALYDSCWQEFYLGSQDGKEAVRPGLTYDLASVSKVVGVGTLMIQGLNSGAFELDETLKSYYPAVRDGSLTLRQLLTHTSGIDPFIPNRDRLDARQLKGAVEAIKVRSDKTFHYTDINFLLLGFMLEHYYGKSLAELFEERIFNPFGMSTTSFGPVSEAVPTVRGVEPGRVHDPKSRVLGNQSGSAGLFSTVGDLQLFLEHYLQDDFAKDLNQDFGFDRQRQRSVAWDKQGDWLLHTGYTGTFIMYNRPLQKAAIFLSNRTYLYDDRPLWISKCRDLQEVIKDHLQEAK